MLLQSFFAIALAFSLTQVDASQNGGLTVHTVEGNVVGTLVSPTVRRFLGIPYAVANRWEAPRSAPVRSAPFNASKFGDSCPQALPASLKAIGFPSGKVPESDGCLSINIWAPSTQRKQHTAVMLWIYGGEFQFGPVCSRKF
jgi:carboxylesterase type B